jgi:uncharacterized protein involved in exopolysaccharide biosynthesis
MALAHRIFLGTISLLFVLPAQAQERQPLVKDSTALISIQREQLVHEIARVESRLVELRNTYTEQHPDVVSLRDQLESLRAKLTALQNQQTSTAADLSKHIADIESRLVELQRTYTVHHPDVLSLRDELQRLRAQREASGK